MNRAEVRQTRIRPLRLSATMTRYLARQFAARFLALLVVILAIITLVTTVEMLDQFSTHDAVPLSVTVELALLRLPRLTQEVMPFIVLFAAMATFWRLTRSNELVVARAAGISVWQFLLPAIAVAVLVGIATTTVVNPIAAVTERLYDRIAAEYRGEQPSLMAVSETGLWLRQAEGDGVAVIHAEQVSPETMTLHDVIVFRYADEDRFVGRLDAKRAELSEGAWQIYDAWHTRPGRESEFLDHVEIATEFTVEKIYNSFAPPETISFWALPEFIQMLESAGFTAEPHKLHLHRLLSAPLLLAAMILLAATFTLRHHRRGGVAIMILIGVITGFTVYLVSNLVFALGMSSKLPVALAAWTPAGVSLMLGLAILLHLEDG